MNEENNIRINKYLSEIGFCSRREADKFIDQGRIKINNEIALMGQKVSGQEKIEVNGKEVINANTKNIYIAFNKPSGIVCTTAVSYTHLTLPTSAIV